MSCMIRNIICRWFNQREAVRLHAQGRGNMRPVYVHAGVLVAVKHVWADLERHGILSALLDTDNEARPGAAPDQDGRASPSEDSAAAYAAAIKRRGLNRCTPCSRQ